jgi:mono/diheme cytochrome c family protein
MRTVLKSPVLLPAMLAALWLPLIRGLAEVPPEGADFFAKNIQPLFKEHCYKCHSHAADKIKGGLVLDSLDGALTGGDTGPALVPGDPAKSLLITAVGYRDEDLQMPPKGKKLNDDQIALLTEWVKMGAPWSKPANGQKMAVRARGKITDEDRQWWAFQPLANPDAPKVEDGGWSVNEIDRFVFQKLTAAGLTPAPPAKPEQLVRRIYFDLIGLPPTPEESAAFVSDLSHRSHASQTALVDKLLADSRYGEHWARHWLDLVRYAESDGFKADDYRPNAWPYRDYVIAAFNRDKPYDRFVQEQLAGDELFPGDPEARTGTAFLRHWIYEYNNRDVAGQWTNILNDLTDVTADVFLGLGVQCARCHDHKFDPILQNDYFRLQAFFAPIKPRDDLFLVTPQDEAVYREKLKAWEEKTADLRQKIADLERPYRDKAAEEAIEKFPPETQAIVRKPAGERTPLEEQLAALAWRQVEYEWDHLLNRMKSTDKDQWVALNKQLAAFDNLKPPTPTPAFCVTDLGPHAPPVRIPKKESLGEIAPGFLTLLDAKSAAIPPLNAPHSTTGRRAALARWLTAPENPLAARVIVNRVWQYHFGRGLVATTSDFGKLGEPPSHPELLDWLTRRFITDGWSFKKLHRLILTSATWQQSVLNPQSPIFNPQLVDPENRLLSHATTRRLEAEQIRDAILSVTGELDSTAGGPSVDPSQPRRTIYTKVRRNTHDPLLEVFDRPDAFSSVAQRNTTTTPTQSLLMINSPWMLARAKAFAARVERDNSSDLREQLRDALRLAFARDPQPVEIERIESFLAKQEELVATRVKPEKETPFVAEKIRFRDGQAALFTPGSTQERFTITKTADLPDGDFTVEAFVNLRSSYDDGSVRTIAATFDGVQGNRGWQFGVTGKKSRYKPETLVLLLSGDGTPESEPTEPIFSGVSIEPGKPYFVAVSVKLGDTSESGVTFYVKDMTNDDQPIIVAGVSHRTHANLRTTAPLSIGGRSGAPKHLWDGVIDDVRLSIVALEKDQLLFTKEGLTQHTCGYWRFEPEPGVFKDSTPAARDIQARTVAAPKVDAKQSALVDFCHVLLNSNEFLYVD